MVFYTPAYINTWPSKQTIPNYSPVQLCCRRQQTDATRAFSRYLDVVVCVEDRAGVVSMVQSLVLIIPSFHHRLCPLLPLAPERLLIKLFLHFLQNCGEFLFCFALFFFFISHCSLIQIIWEWFQACIASNVLGWQGEHLLLHASPGWPPGGPIHQYTVNVKIF